MRSRIEVGETYINGLGDEVEIVHEIKEPINSFEVMVGIKTYNSASIQTVISFDVYGVFIEKEDHLQTLVGKKTCKEKEMTREDFEEALYSLRGSEFIKADIRHYVNQLEKQNTFNGKTRS